MATADHREPCDSTGHARFWERPGVKLPRATRQGIPLGGIAGHGFGQTFEKKGLARIAREAQSEFMAFASI